MSVVCIDILHGLKDDVIKDIVKKCDILFTPDDVMKNFPIWSYDIAIQICSVICEVFADFEMYNCMMKILIDANTLY